VRNAVRYWLQAKKAVPYHTDLLHLPGNGRVKTWNMESRLNALPRLSTICTVLQNVGGGRAVGNMLWPTHYIDLSTIGRIDSKLAMAYKASLRADILPMCPKISAVQDRVSGVIVLSILTRRKPLHLGAG